MTLVELLLAGDDGTAELREAARTANRAEVSAAVALAGQAEAPVRIALALVLTDLAGDPPTDELVQVAIGLSSDPEERVRDRACFALAQLWVEVDSPALRDALAARLDDPHVDTRCEALVGLAHRHDPRALPAVRAALSRPNGVLFRLELTAAGALSDPVLHALVLRHQQGWDDDGVGGLADVVRRLTDPAGPGEDVLDGVAELYRRRGSGRPDGHALGWWRVLSATTELAPHRAGDFFDAVLSRLAGDDPAIGSLWASALAQEAAAAGHPQLPGRSST